ncbi:MAG: RNA-directed DNA polymerase [Planctomycetota bacterium]|jgi:RNA-directed DNA polymerase
MEFYGDQVTHLWRQALRRRSQKARMTWERMNRYAVRWLPNPKICHPYPDQRFDVTYPR